jgi:hypothetical protein
MHKSETPTFVCGKGRENNFSLAVAKLESEEHRQRLRPGLG